MTHTESLYYISMIPPEDRSAQQELMLQFARDREAKDRQERINQFVGARMKQIMEDPDYREDVLITLVESRSGADFLWSMVKHSDVLRAVAKKIARSEASVKFGAYL
jgi:glycyl-tRNA synthetase beta subunit